MKLDRIQIDPERMNGQPCIRDLRLTSNKEALLLCRISASASDVCRLADFLLATQD